MNSKKLSYNNDVLRRLKIVEGHLKRVIHMVEENKYCIDIIHQSLAVQNALKKIDSIILERHLTTCIPKAIPKINKKKQQELLNIFKASRK